MKTSSSENDKASFETPNALKEETEQILTDVEMKDTFKVEANCKEKKSVDEKGKLLLEYFENVDKMRIRKFSLLSVEKSLKAMPNMYNPTERYVALHLFDSYFSRNDELNGCGDKAALVCLKIASRVLKGSGLIDDSDKEESRMEVAILNGVEWEVDLKSPFAYLKKITELLHVHFCEDTLHRLIYNFQKEASYFRYRPFIIAGGAVVVSTGLTIDESAWVFVGDHDDKVSFRECIVEMKLVQEHPENLPPSGTPGSITRTDNSEPRDPTSLKLSPYGTPCSVTRAVYSEPRAPPSLSPYGTPGSVTRTDNSEPRAPPSLSPYRTPGSVTRTDNSEPRDHPSLSPYRTPGSVTRTDNSEPRDHPSLKLSPYGTPGSVARSLHFEQRDPPSLKLSQYGTPGSVARTLLFEQRDPPSLKLSPYGTPGSVTRTDFSEPLAVEDIIEDTPPPESVIECLKNWLLQYWNEVKDNSFREWVQFAFVHLVPLCIISLCKGEGFNTHNGEMDRLWWTLAGFIFQTCILICVLVNYYTRAASRGFVLEGVLMRRQGRVFRPTPCDVFEVIIGLLSFFTLLYHFVEQLMAALH